MPNLFPEGYEEEVVTEADIQDETVIGYRRGPAFSFEQGDFMRNGQNQIIEATGIESWEIWCINCLQTERYKHKAYSTDFGIETAPAFAASSREEAESHLNRQITEALMADPYGRTAYVENIEYNWTQPDSIVIRVVAHGIEDVTLDITATITR